MDEALKWVGPMKKAYNAGGKKACMKYIEKKEDDWKEIPLNVAVIGGSGVGKSTFINAIRYLTAEDEGAAEVSTNECTKDIREYPHPNNPLLLFWDMPGAGTLNFPKETYMSDIEVDRYDFFLLITANRFTENDAWLAKEIGKRQMGFFFVRTKIDVDVSGDKDSHPKAHNKQTVVETIRQRSSNNLGEIGFKDIPNFLIDSRKPHDYDFHKLEVELVDNFPKFKRSALVLSLKASNENMVALKVKELSSKIWMSSCLSAVVGVVPVPGVSFLFDLRLAVRRCELYFNQLGLDAVSLQRLCSLMSADCDELQSIIVKNLGRVPTGAADFEIVVMSILQKVPVTTTTRVAAEAAKIIPVIGSIICVPVSYNGTYAVLTAILETMSNTAMEVVAFSSKQAAKLDQPSK